MTSVCCNTCYNNLQHLLWPAAAPGAAGQLQSRCRCALPTPALLRLQTPKAPASTGQRSMAYSNVTQDTEQYDQPSRELQHPLLTVVHLHPCNVTSNHSRQALVKNYAA
jgi:hypothetical protein